MKMSTFHVCMFYVIKEINVLLKLKGFKNVQVIEGQSC